MAFDTLRNPVCTDSEDKTDSSCGALYWLHLQQSRAGEGILRLRAIGSSEKGSLFESLRESEVVPARGCISECRRRRFSNGTSYALAAARRDVSCWL